MKEKTYGFSSFGIWLKCSLVERKMKQKDLAKMLNTSEAGISRYVHGNRIPRRKELQKILDIFGCHIEIVPNDEV